MQQERKQDARSRWTKVAVPAALMAAMLVFGKPALATSLAVTPAGTLVDSPTPYDLTLAWDFRIAPNQSFQVTALDFYSNGTPYTTSHQVGIWSTDASTGYAPGTLLATVTFSAANPGTANGVYRSLAITPIVLNAGAYEVGAFVPGQSDRFLYSQDSYTLLPGITFAGSHVISGSAFAYPGETNIISVTNFAANFEATPVPLPASAWLLLSGLLGLIVVRQRATLRS